MTEKTCKCSNLKLLLDIVDLYDGLGVVYAGKSVESSYLQREQAYNLTEKLLKIISEKDLSPWVTEERSRKRKLENFKRGRALSRICSENKSHECIYALEEIRFIIHNDAGIRAKILCEKDIYSQNNKQIKEAMNALRGINWDTSKQAKFIIEDLYKTTTCTSIIHD